MDIIGNALKDYFSHKENNIITMPKLKTQKHPSGVDS